MCTRWSQKCANVKRSLETKELIHKAKSDNKDLFRNFAATIGANPLTREVHGAGAGISIYLHCCERLVTRFLL
jgi:hypothetical protein